jgi:hypothetical protein
MNPGSRMALWSPWKGESDGDPNDAHAPFATVRNAKLAIPQGGASCLERQPLVIGPGG